MRYNFLFIVILLFSLCACKKNRQENIYLFESYTPLEKISVVSDSIFLGRPGSLLVINDWLAVYDSHDGEMVTWIAPDMKTYKRNVAIGTGPGEFMPPLTIYSSDFGKKVRLMLRSTSTCYTFNWEDVMDECFKHPLSIVSLPKVPGKILPCTSGFVMNNVQDDNKMFSFLSSNGEELCRFGIYPGNIDNVKGDSQSRNMVTQTTMAYSEKHRVMVAAGYMSDMLSFYRMEDDTVSLVNEYFSIEANMKVVQVENGYRLMPTSDTKSTYLELYATESYLYALYWGSQYGKLPEKNYIQVFDWNGNFKKGFVVADVLTSIAVDEKKGIMYGISRVKDPVINIYKLP